MKTSRYFVYALMALGLTVTGCDKDKKDDKTSALTATSLIQKVQWTEQTAEQAQIRIINQFDEPVAGAQVLIGDAQDAPFRNNLVKADNLGVASIPAEWTDNAAVTVDARGYIRQTLLNQKPGNLTIRLSSAYLAERAEVKGQVTQMPVVNGDKLIDFALVMPALTKADLLNFDIDQVISPYSDTLSVMGQSNAMPSNISLPKQSENYFLNITLEKPVYRLKVPTLGPKRFAAVRGRFVFKTVADELRAGKPFYDLINHFSILGGGLREATLTGPNTNLDIPGVELSFGNTIKVNPVAVQSDEVSLVLAASDMAGTMVPTDIKKMSGQAMNLQSLAGKPAYVINVAKKQSEFANSAGRMSAALSPYDPNLTAKLLPLMANPTVTNNGGYAITLAAAPAVAGINPLATTAVISDLTEIRDGEKTILITTKKWEVLGLGWGRQISLPKWPLAGSASRKRVEVNYIGTTGNSPTALGNSLIENATHVTHAVTDF